MEASFLCAWRLKTLCVVWDRWCHVLCNTYRMCLLSVYAVSTEICMLTPTVHSAVCMDSIKQGCILLSNDFEERFVELKCTAWCLKSTTCLFYLKLTMFSSPDTHRQPNIAEVYMFITSDKSWWISSNQLLSGERRTRLALTHFLGVAPTPFSHSQSIQHWHEWIKTYQGRYASIEYFTY